MSRAESPYRASRDGVVLAVKVTPKAHRDVVLGIDYHGDRPVLRVRVTAAPDKGRANKALLKLIGKWLGIPTSSIHLVSGGNARLKSLFLEGDADDRMRRLTDALIGNRQKQ
ncbi:MAG: DUF167 family protein [Methyloligellaceae bacterium]